MPAKKSRRNAETALDLPCSSQCPGGGEPELRSLAALAAPEHRAEVCLRPLEQDRHADGLLPVIDGDGADDVRVGRLGEAATASGGRYVQKTAEWGGGQSRS